MRLGLFSFIKTLVRSVLSGGFGVLLLRGEGILGRGEGGRRLRTVVLVFEGDKGVLKGFCSSRMSLRMKSFEFRKGSNDSAGMSRRNSGKRRLKTCQGLDFSPHELLSSEKDLSSSVGINPLPAFMSRKSGPESLMRTCICSNGDETRLALGPRRGAVMIYSNDALPPKRPMTELRDEDEQRDLSVVSMSWRGELLAAGTTRGTMIWDVEKQDLLGQLPSEGKNLTISTKKMIA